MPQITDTEYLVRQYVRFNVIDCYEYAHYRHTISAAFVIGTAEYLE